MIIGINSWIDKKDIVRYIYEKRVTTFLNQINRLEETLMSRLIYPVMQQKQI